MDSITIDDLQKMSAGSISALPHAVPIKSGAATVGLLVPIHKPPPEVVARVMAQVDAAAAERSAEETARLAALVGEEAG